jgi:dimethylargininase
MLAALTRSVSSSFANCQVTYLERTPIDVQRAAAQHADYCAALQRHAITVLRLPAEDALPDAVFVEDPLLVLDEVAIALRPGASSRSAEVASLVPVIARFFPVERLPQDGTVDGGDVLRVGRTLYIGLSTRTTTEGARSLAGVVARFGYTVVPVRVHGCLHLKSACTWLGDRVLLNPQWLDTAPFRTARPLHVAETWAADVLLLPEALLMPASFPATTALLQQHGYDVETVDVSELQKAEAGVTCMSVLFHTAVVPRDLQSLVVP